MHYLLFVVRVNFKCYVRVYCSSLAMLERQSHVLPLAELHKLIYIMLTCCKTSILLVIVYQRFNF